jgi:hypothetical protein
MRLPCLSGLPAIFQVFFGLATSVAHFGHLAIQFSSMMLLVPWFPMMMDK